MYSLPPAVLFNERTGRLELCHADIMRRVRRTHRLRSRYRSMVVRRLAVAAFKAPWRGAVALMMRVRGCARPHAARDCPQ